MISRPQTAYSIGRRSRSPGRNPILCPPSWPGHTRAKSIQEKNIVDQKRYQENRTNRTISAHNFFENGTILAEKQDVWADSYISPKNQTKVSSLISTPNLVTPIPLGSENYEFSDYKMSKRPSTAGSVQTGFYSNMSDGSTLASNFSRKERLKMLLDEEDEAYKSYKQEEESTKELRKKQLKLLREKHAQRKKEKEEARKAKAAELMYEQFKKNCPQLRDIESSKLQEHVKTVWKDQIQEKDILRLEEEKERELEKQNMERMETARVETENRKKLEDIAAKKAIADALAFQLEELKTKNNEFKGRREPILGVFWRCLRSWERILDGPKKFPSQTPRTRKRNHDSSRKRVPKIARTARNFTQKTPKSKTRQTSLASMESSITTENARATKRIRIR